MKGGCERASPSPADKRTPKILMRPRAARSPSPRRLQEQAVPALSAKGSLGGRRHGGEQRRMLINYFPRWQTCPPTSLTTPGSHCHWTPGRGTAAWHLKSTEQGIWLWRVALQCHRGTFEKSLLLLTHLRASLGAAGAAPRGICTPAPRFRFVGVCGWLLQTPGWGQGLWGGGPGWSAGTSQP